jgi:hypothetical protein
VKKIMILLALIGIGTFALHKSVSAVDVVDPVCNTDSVVQSEICDDVIIDDSNPIVGPEGLLTRAVNILSIVIGIVATIVLIWSGLRYVMSQGDSGKITTARSQIIYAVVGIIIAALAQAIVHFVLKRTGV